MAAAVSGRSVALRQNEEDIVNANSRAAAKNLAQDGEDDAEIRSEDDDGKNRNGTELAAIGVKAGPSSTGSGSGMQGKTDKEKKVGHRRVTQGGDVTYKKIQTTQIMGSIQLGVQHAIGGLASKPERDLLIPDFFTVEQTNFPSGGSNQTPAHHYSDFRFKAYAPMAFRHFRELFEIQTDDFLMSLCSQPLRELTNPGASGSIFYLSYDDEFIIKTVQHKECEFLQKLLPGYYMNLDQNPRTLLPKFFGLFTYQCNSKNVRLCVMNNILPSYITMHQKYDLKGSTYKRKANKQECEKKHPTYKDLDFLVHHPDGIMLESDTCDSLLKTLRRDCRVLESFKIMDYSLLVGIHNLDIAAKEKAERRRQKPESEDDEEAEIAGKGLSRSKSINRQKLVAHSTAMESIQAESEPIDADDDVPQGGIPARNAKGERLLLYLGLIDILQSYRLKKKLEHTFKAMIHDGDTVSVHRPGFYAERFMNFMTEKVFRKITSLDLPEVKGNHRKFRNLVSSYLALKHSPSKKRPTMRLRGNDEAGDNVAGSSKVTSPISCSSLKTNAQSPPIMSPTSQEGSGGVEAGGGAVGMMGSREMSGLSGTKRHGRGLQVVGGGDNGSGGAPSEGTVGTSVPSSSGGGGGAPQPVSSPPSSSGAMFPAVLNKEPSRGASMNRGKIPPPVPPRTPKRSVLEGSNETPLPVSTPPPPFQEKLLLLQQQGSNGHGQQHGYGGGGGRAGGNWNLTQSQSPQRRVVSGGGGGGSSGGSASSSLEHPGRRLHQQMMLHNSGVVMTDSETVSVSEVFVETRVHRSTLSVASSSTTSGVSSSLGHHHNRLPRSPPTGIHEFSSRNTSATPTWTEGTPSFTESSSSGDFGPVTPAKEPAPKNGEEDNEAEMTRL